MDKMIDAYIIPQEINGEENYTMYFCYNEQRYNRIKAYSKEVSLADSFKRKILGEKRGFVFSDIEGNILPHNDYNAVIAYIEGLDNIRISMDSLIASCTNLDVQSDFSVFINGDEHPIVRDTSQDGYHASDSLGISKKGYSFQEVLRLEKNLEILSASLKKEENITL